MHTEQNKVCSIVEQSRLHEASGLRIMPSSESAIPMTVSATFRLPSCCPISGNPREGSTLTLRYRAGNGLLEVETMKAHIRAYIGGYPGSPCGTYPEERNMEGMIALIAQQAADALGVRVHARADLNLNTGKMVVKCLAHPNPEAAR